MRSAAGLRAASVGLGAPVAAAVLLIVIAGCSDDDDFIGAGGGGDAGGSPPAMPTWHQHVAPLVSARCTGCHRPGGIGPFSMQSYDSAKPFAAAMALAASTGRMPPWHAVDTDECKPRFPWKQDIRLTADEKALLERWAAAGAPAGDAGKAASLPTPRTLDLANRSMRITMDRPFTVQGPGADVFRCFPLPYQFPEDVWITGLQVVPGNNEIVHHVLVWSDPARQSDARAGGEGSYQCFGAPGFTGGALLGAWAPGGNPIEPPPGVGVRVPAGAKIVLNIHYHPGAQPADDVTSLDLRWTTTPPDYEAVLSLPGNARTAIAGLQPGPADPPEGPAFLIPAGAKGHEERMAIAVSSAVRPGTRVFSVGTHMHYVGTDMKFELARGNRVGGAPADEPERECLIQTPRWDFHWQRGYSYDAPIDQLPTVGRGDVVHLRCRYDNSTDNPFVMAALREQGLSQPRDVSIGEQTLDEMCLGVVGTLFPRQ
jgi:hypothetical protein